MLVHRESTTGQDGYPFSAADPLKRLAIPCCG